MKHYLHIAFWIVMFSAMTLPALRAQTYRPETDTYESGPPDAGQPPRKGRSVFWRAARDTAAEQLDYARELEQDGRLRAAARQYNALVHRWHASEEAPAAQHAYARLLMERGRHERAFREFQYLIEYYPGQFRYNPVLEDQLRIANHVMGERRATFLFFRGFAAPERGLPLLETILSNAPNWHKAPEVRLRIGGIHEQQKDYQEAVEAYEATQSHHPASPQAEEAAFRKAICLVRISDQSRHEEPRCRAALSALAAYLARYPQTERRPEVESLLETLRHRLEEMVYERVRYYDDIEKRPRAALVGYQEFLKNFPGSTRAPGIEQRIETLETLLEKAE